MRKFLFAALVSTALVVAVPATAVARHHHRHHHQLRIRHEQFGSTGSESTSGDEQQADAGTVDSFTGGVLTIRLTDGSLVSGMVTGSTELQCESTATETQSGDDSSGDGSGDQSSGDNGSGDDSGDNDQGEDEQMCTTSALTPGTVVQNAELNISSTGAVWHEVELITP